MTKILLLLVLCAALAGCAKAPPPPTEAPPIKSIDVVKVTPQPLTLAPGESGEAVVALQINSGYHVNANPPTFSYLKATELAITPSDGISVEFMRYPDGVMKKFEFAEKPLAVYEGATVLKAQLKADKSAKPGAHNLSAKLRVQACDEAVCYAPGELEVKVPVNIR
jgi:hypothetical protein